MALSADVSELELRVKKRDWRAVIEFRRQIQQTTQSGRGFFGRDPWGPTPEDPVPRGAIERDGAGKETPPPCEECGREFDTAHGLATHEGIAHGGRDATTTCGYCDAPLHREPARLERADTHYCDHECRAADLRTGREIDCEWCGDTVYKSQRELDDNDHNFCTKTCYSAHKRAHNPAEFQPESVRGYPYWRITSNLSVTVHQLLAIAEGADPHKVFADEYNVHHANGCEFDNRPENIEVLHVSEHGRRDGGKRVKQYTQMDLLHVVSFFLNGPLPTE